MSLLIRAILQAPHSNATFADVANQMLIIANADGKPVQYRNFIRNRLTMQQVVVSPVPLTADMAEDTEFQPSPQALLLAHCRATALVAAAL